MTVKLKEPTFEEVQWTGANLATIRSFVDGILGPTHEGARRTYAEQDDGALMIYDSATMMSAYLNTSDWLLFGPLFGADKSQAGWRTTSPSEFTSQYETVVE